MIFKSKSKFDMLDQYLAQHDYTAALEAIVEEIKRKPENFNLLLRQAEILGLAGNREAAIAIYRKLARQFAEDGFYARAIAVTNKLLRLDPEHPEVTRELAGLISAKQEAEETARQRFKSVKPVRSAPAQAPTPPPPATPEPEVSEALLAEPGASASRPSLPRAAPPPSSPIRRPRSRRRRSARHRGSSPSFPPRRWRSCWTPPPCARSRPRRPSSARAIPGFPSFSSRRDRWRSSPRTPPATR